MKKSSLILGALAVVFLESKSKEENKGKIEEQLVNVYEDVKSKLIKEGTEVLNNIKEKGSTILENAKDKGIDAVSSLGKKLDTEQGETK